MVKHKHYYLPILYSLYTCNPSAAEKNEGTPESNHEKHLSLYLLDSVITGFIPKYLGKVTTKAFPSLVRLSQKLTL